MSIRTSFNPMGTLGADAWPAALLPGLLDGWLLRTPEHSAKGGEVIQTLTPSSNDTNSYKFVERPQWTAKTVLFCSMDSFKPVSAYNVPSFGSGSDGDNRWIVCFYGIENLPAGSALATNIGIIVDTPRRYAKGSFRVNIPFEAVCTYDYTAKPRVYTAQTGWMEIPLDGGKYNAAIRWIYCKAWAAYDSVLDDAEALRRLEILKQFATQQQ